MGDIEKLPYQIHGVISSDSDSDPETKSYFDEEYNLLKPPPLDYDIIKHNIVKISPKIPGNIWEERQKDTFQNERSEQSNETEKTADVIKKKRKRKRNILRTISPISEVAETTKKDFNLNSDIFKKPQNDILLYSDIVRNNIKTKSIKHQTTDVIPLVSSSIDMTIDNSSERIRSIILNNDFGIIIGNKKKKKNSKKLSRFNRISKTEEFYIKPTVITVDPTKKKKSRKRSKKKYLENISVQNSLTADVLRANQMTNLLKTNINSQKQLKQDKKKKKAVTNLPNVISSQFSEKELCGIDEKIDKIKNESVWHTVGNNKMIQEEKEQRKRKEHEMYQRWLDACKANEEIKSIILDNNFGSIKPNKKQKEAKLEVKQTKENTEASSVSSQKLSQITTKKKKKKVNNKKQSSPESTINENSNIFMVNPNNFVNLECTSRSKTLKCLECLNRDVSLRYSYDYFGSNFQCFMDFKKHYLNMCLNNVEKKEHGNGKNDIACSVCNRCLIKNNINKNQIIFEHQNNLSVEVKVFYYEFQGKNFKHFTNFREIYLSGSLNDLVEKERERKTNSDTIRIVQDEIEKNENDVDCSVGCVIENNINKNQIIFEQQNLREDIKLFYYEFEGKNFNHYASFREIYLSGSLNNLVKKEREKTRNSNTIRVVQDELEKNENDVDCSVGSVIKNNINKNQIIFEQQSNLRDEVKYFYYEFEGNSFNHFTRFREIYLSGSLSDLFEKARKKNKKTSSDRIGIVQDDIKNTYNEFNINNSNITHDNNCLVSDSPKSLNTNSLLFLKILHLLLLFITIYVFKIILNKIECYIIENYIQVILVLILFVFILSVF